MLKRRGVGEAGEGTAGPQHSNWSIKNDKSITDLWTYFDLMSGMIQLDDFVFNLINITTFPNPEDKKPAQLGYGGNWRDMNYGFSMWFDCQNIPGFNAGSHCGDVNVNLTKVPEPGTLGLIGLGLGALVLMRRRQPTH